MIVVASGRKPGSNDAGYTANVTWIADARSSDRVLSLRGVYTNYGKEMDMTWRLAPIIKGAIVVAAVLPAAGCAAAVVGGAGAASGIYLTSRGAESVVEGPVDQVAARAKSVMNEMDIVQDEQSSKDQGAKREFKGKKGDLDVTVRLESQSTKTTKVEASARKNLVEWDKDFAKDLVSRIVEKS
jgi:hypothetical protein